MGVAANLLGSHCITDRSYPAAAMPHWQEKKENFLHGNDPQRTQIYTDSDPPIPFCENLRNLRMVVRDIDEGGPACFS